MDKKDKNAACADDAMSNDPPVDPSVHMRVSNPPRAPGSTVYSSSEYYRMISQAAYYLAEHRGFQSGHELEDWLAAEREISTTLGRSTPDAEAS